MATVGFRVLDVRFRDDIVSLLFMLTSNLYRTMKRIKILAIVIVSVVSAYGQETYTYSNPDRDFYEGKELYVQQKYSIAERYFENFIENRNAETHPELLQEAH